MEDEAGTETGTETGTDTAASKSYWLSQKMVLRWLSGIQKGSLVITDQSGVHAFGSQEGQDVIRVQIQVKDMQFYKKILLQGVLGAAESYMDGDWETDDLTRLIELMIINSQVQDKIENPYIRFMNRLQRFRRIFHKNDITSAKQNIIAHYDLGNDFFKLFLDPNMMYSSALYEPERISLEHASLKKLENICQQLQLKPSDHVLEIGTGWGGFAFYAARKHGCRVTTTTISDKQYAYVKNEIAHLGLQNRIELLNQDYRNLTGRYDKLVSIEMIEAVGDRYFNVFFRQCNQLLKPGGLLFLQAITINDQNYESAKDQMDFIKKYIFPGGCLPSVNTISQCIATQTRMQLLQMRDIGKHYAVTLLDWLKRFNNHVDKVREQGFPERFIRMWRFYLCYCAAGFRQAYIGDIQGLWRKRD